MTEELSERQAKILDYIRYVTRVRNYPPSVREIGEAVGLSSSSTVHNHLNQLERRGLIKRDASKSRTVQPGDSLWSIASNRYPGTDVRNRIWDIQQANHLDSALLTPGELLKVPTR